LQAVPSPLASGRNQLEVRPGEPIVITGGARGITSLIAAEMAHRWQPTLLLIGSSRLPSDGEDSELSELEAPADIKALIYDRLSRSGRAPSPGELERDYQTVIRRREIRRNIEVLRAAGSHVEYAQADVRDSSSMHRVLSDWQRRFGDPVGVIHGAGLIKDKLARDKTPEMFDRVLGTKLDGALNLVGLLNPAKLKFTVLFSSIAGRFGNRGQSDYSAANEVLNKLAIWLDRRRPGRVVSMIWGPWSGIGMVSDIEAHLDSQGLGMITPAVGVAALMDELIMGRKGDVEVIVSAHLGTLDGPLRRTAEPVESAR
jgi:NAD(P)-dependent dehydrogenase (short-subunit alcohol dehydrogenase family)